MRFSSVKYNAVKDYTKDFNERLSYLVPFFEYHERWTSLERSDFEKFGYEADHCTRGYHLITGKYFKPYAYNELDIPLYILDDEAEPTEFTEEALQYLDKIVDFCNEKNIKLVLTKTPAGGWSSSDHKAVTVLAEKYGLDFADFNFEPFIDEIDYDHALDSAEGVHLNYYGASKLTAWFGEYLLHNCYVDDVREKPEYAYMKEQLEKYHMNVDTVVGLKSAVDPFEYISLAMKNRNYAVFIAVKGDAAAALTQEQREGFASIGLEGLADLEYKDSYLAVIQNGNVVYELPEDSNGNEKIPEDFVFSHEGVLNNGTIYALAGGSYENGNIASCVINGNDYARNSQGLNIIVYDTYRYELVDSSYFDTNVSPVRDDPDIAASFAGVNILEEDYSTLSEDIQKLYLYHYRCEAARNAAIFRQSKKDGLLKYLLEYWDKENCVIFISAKEEANALLDEEARIAFEEKGLHELAMLEYNDSYLAVVNNGQVMCEQKGQNGILVEAKEGGWQMVSGDLKSEKISSIKINGVEYSPNMKGVNVVIYDTLLDAVIDSASFDTSSISMNVSE